ncbi:MAG: alpha/beta fold hydrolase [Solirubrobacteraceae bacterium]
MELLEVNAQRLYASRRGAGEPLLLIQGLSGNTLHWTEPFLEELEPGFELIAYDHRGIGHSQAGPGPYSIKDLADDAAGLLDVLELDAVHVLGISMGGMVAQELTLRHPGRVRTLSLGCTSPGGPERVDTDPAVVSRLMELGLSGQMGRLMEEGYAFNVSPTYARDPAGLELMRELAQELPGSLPVLLAQLQALTGHDASARLGEIAVPTLIMHGSEDRILPVGNAHVLARLIPGARLEIFADVGHLFWWERPQESARLVRELAGAPAPQ